MNSGTVIVVLVLLALGFGLFRLGRSITSVNRTYKRGYGSADGVDFGGPDHRGHHDAGGHHDMGGHHDFGGGGGGDGGGGGGHHG